MTQFKTSDDLQEHYWSVIVPMVRKYNQEHGTDIKPWECVRSASLQGIPLKQHPIFYECHLNNTTFAIEILECIPVFVGDRIWGKNINDYLIAYDGMQSIEDCTWTPPPPAKKRTFMLQLTEEKLSLLMRIPIEQRMFDDPMMFELLRDIKKLTEARDKE